MRSASFKVYLKGSTEIGKEVYVKICEHLAIQTGDSMLIRENMKERGSSSPEHRVSLFSVFTALAVIVILSKTLHFSDVSFPHSQNLNKKHSTCKGTRRNNCRIRVDVD